MHAVINRVDYTKIRMSVECTLKIVLSKTAQKIIKNRPRSGTNDYRKLINLEASVIVHTMGGCSFSCLSSPLLHYASPPAERESRGRDRRGALAGYRVQSAARALVGERGIGVVLEAEVEEALAFTKLNGEVS